MALIDNRPQRIFFLCSMYFAQGLPWGFMATALPSYLSERGVGDKEIGHATAMILLPWTFKLVWGPIIDSFTVRSMGRRRTWILGAQFMMATSLLAMLTLGDFSIGSDSALWIDQLAWMFFAHNCFASLQDVATDALALDVLPANEQGRVNSLMWATKLIGKATGAVVMASLLNSHGLALAVWVQFGLLLVIMLVPLLLLERRGEKRFPWSRGGAMGPESTEGVRKPWVVAAEVLRGFSLPAAAACFAFGTLSNIGWGIVEVITKTLYTQRLGWDDESVSRVVAAAVVFELVGAMAGGWLSDRYGPRRAVWLGYGGYGVLACLFAMFPGLWGLSWFAAGYSLLNPGCLAVGNVGYLALSMRLSWTASAATMFTLLMTVSNLGHVIGNECAGKIRDDYQFGYEQSFWIAGTTVIVPLLFLFFVRTRDIDAIRKGEV